MSRPPLSGEDQANEILELELVVAEFNAGACGFPTGAVASECGAKALAKMEIGLT